MRDNDIRDAVERWLAAGERVALATVVSVIGSAPRAVGATLAIGERGSLSGSVSGGCVEPAVIEAGQRVIRSGQPTLLQFGITAQQNVEQIGLSCGGEIRVYVEPLRGPASDALLRALHTDRAAVYAAIIASHGSSLPADLAPGLAFTITDATHQLTPSISSPLADAILASAQRRLASGVSGVERLPLHPDASVEIFYAAYTPPPILIIIGAGHITIPLTRIAKTVGYHTIVIDPRAVFATHERLPDADELLLEWPDEALQRLPLRDTTAIAVLTHDEKFDIPALQVALRAEVGYIGAIGSRATSAQRDQQLRAAGLDDQRIARIHSPIGLDIGASDPAQIALAIMAEIVATRHMRQTARLARSISTEQPTESTTIHTP